VPEEYTLARRIERWQRRLRWALYTTPVALPTLRTLCDKVVDQALTIDVVVQPCDGSPDPSARQAHVQQALQHLHALAAQLEAGDRPTGAATQAQRGRRHAQFRL
jgi:hypothetical protein